MPDITLAEGLICTARTLCTLDAGEKQMQSNMRRAVSSAYYAVFHELARNCADVLVGAKKSTRPNRAWVEVYRGLDHGKVKDACNGAESVAFPPEIKEFAEAFKVLQGARHAADYDPMIRLGRVGALSFVSLAEDSIGKLRCAPKKDRIAFAAWVLITGKGAVDARKRMRTGKPREIQL